MPPRILATLVLWSLVATGCSDNRPKYDTSRLNFNRPFSGFQYSNLAYTSLRLYGVSTGFNGGTAAPLSDQQAVRLRVDGQWFDAVSDDQGFIEADILKRADSVDVFVCLREACQAWFDLPQGNYLLGVRSLRPGEGRVPEIPNPRFYLEKTFKLKEAFSEDMHLHLISHDYIYSKEVLAGTTEISIPVEDRLTWSTYHFNVLASTESHSLDRLGYRVLDIESLKLIGKVTTMPGEDGEIVLKPLTWQEIKVDGPQGNSWIKESPKTTVKVEIQGWLSGLCCDGEVRLERKIRWEDMGNTIQIPQEWTWNGLRLSSHHPSPQLSQPTELAFETVSEQSYLFPPNEITLPILLESRKQPLRMTDTEIYLGPRPKQANYSSLELEAGDKLLFFYMPKERVKLSRELIREGFRELDSGLELEFRKLRDFSLQELSSSVADGEISHQPLQPRD